MKKKLVDVTLHETRNWPKAKIFKIAERVVSGRVFVRVAHKWLSYTKFNEVGKTDRETWE